MNKLSTRPECVIVSMEGGAQGAHFLSRRNLDNVPFVGGDIIITADFGLFAEFKNL